MKYFLLIVAVACLAPLGHAAIFHCIDDTGKATFKDSECDANEKLIKTIGASTDAPEIEDNSPLGKNLIKNSSFENKLIDWRVPLGALWTSNRGINRSGALIIHAKKPPEDKYIHETVVEQCVIFDAGEKFELAAQVKLEGIPLKKTANRANVIWYESTDCTTGGQWGAYIEPKNIIGWQQLAKKNLTPALGAKAVKITIVQNGRFSNDGKAYWDNITFFPTESFQQSKGNIDNTINEKFTLALGINHVRNGGFDNDLTPWRIRWKTEWSATEGDALPGSARVTAHSKSGSIGSHAFNQCVNFGENRTFELGASFKRDETSAQTGSGRLRLAWHEKSNCKGRSKIGNSADSEDMAGWQKLRVTGLVAPPNSQSATIEIIQSVGGSGQFSVYWDDIYFKAVE